MWGGLALAVAILAGLLHAGFCAFTWRKFTMFDYGVYTNMIWNSGHGQPFRCLLDRSYLATHLSFSLALLGPLFRVWDHPFLLSVLQWSFLAVGAAIVGRTAVRLRIPRVAAVAIILFFVGYHYTQRVLLSEFHGVGSYLLLVPWLYWCLRVNRRMAWLPWLLILGVREEAALVVLPMLLYFAVREKWRGGYGYAALSAVYMVVATTTLYPWLTGISLLDRRRTDLASGLLGATMDLGALQVRATALLWVLLPMVPFLRRKGWVPVVVFPSLALLQAMGGGKLHQYSLALHYSAPVMACLAVAMLESLACRGETQLEDATTRARDVWLPASLLVAITAFSYLTLGFLPGGRQQKGTGSPYTHAHESGLRLLRVARRLPREGVLICPSQLGGFCANRRDIIDWRHYEPKRHRFDVMFTELKYLDDPKMGYRTILQDGTFGATYFDGRIVVLRRGANPSANVLVIEAFERILKGSQFARSIVPTPPGSSVTSLSIPVLHWRGTPRGTSEPLVTAPPYSPLAPGEYEAVFLFAVEAPAAGGLEGWGTLQVRRSGTTEVLAEAQIEPLATGPRAVRTQRVRFTLDAPVTVEAAVIGQRAELWLQRADFVARGEPWDL